MMSTPLQCLLGTNLINSVTDIGAEPTGLGTQFVLVSWMFAAAKDFGTNENVYHLS